MERFKSKKLLTALGTILAIAIMAFVAFWASEKIVVNKNGDVLKGNAGMDYNIDTDLTCEAIVKKACTLVDKYYNVEEIPGRGHGSNNTVWGKDWEDEMIKNASNLLTPDEFKSFDCTGFIYYILTSLGCTTKGFAYNNPVPVDPNNWYKVKDPAGKKSYPDIAPNSNVTMTYNGKTSKINIVKCDEDITESYRYYNTADGGFIPAGSIVIARAPKKATNVHDHGWIYIGKLGNKTPEEIAKILVKEYGVDSSYLINGDIDGEFTIKQYKNDRGELKPCIQKTDEDCEHWRIECTADSKRHGVYINNGDPNALEDLGGGKILGTVYVFQLAKIDITGSYNLTIEKDNASGNPIGSTHMQDVFSVERKVNGANSNITMTNYTDHSVTYSNLNVTKETQTEEITIKEVNAPRDGYAKYNGTITLQLSKSVENNTYKTTISKVLINGVEQTPTQDLFNYDNGKVSINCTNNSISIKVKNPKIDLALKKMIQNVNDVAVTKPTFNSERCDGYSVNLAKLDNGESTNGEYLENKYPVAVKKGDIVKYDIRIYNEGEVNAKASKITDYIPEGLKVTKVCYEQEPDIDLLNNTSSGNTATYNEEKGVLNITLGDTPLINAHVHGNGLSSQIVWVYCLVEDDAEGILTNYAEISEYEIENNEHPAVDIDSTANNWKNPVTNAHDGNTDADKSTSTWNNYDNDQADKTKKEGFQLYTAQDAGVNNNEGDDDDFDKIIILEDYNLKIFKHDDANQPISDIVFTIKKDGEVLKNECLENGRFEYSETMDPDTSSVPKLISYYIEESPNASYIQPKDPMILTLDIFNGKLFGYHFVTESDNGNPKKYTSNHEFTVDSILGTKLKVNVICDLENATIELDIENVPQNSNEYSVNIKKVSAMNTDNVLSGVTFSGTMTEATNIKGATKTGATSADFDTNPTDANGIANIVSNKRIDFSNYSIVDKYIISEIDLGTSNPGYTSKLDTPISLIVAKVYDEEEKNYRVNAFGVKVEGSDALPTNEITIKEDGLDYTISTKWDESTNTITVTVPNYPDTPLSLQFIKVDKETGASISKTKFDIYRKTATNTFEKNNNENIANNIISLDERIDPAATMATYAIVERNPADGYDNVLAGKYILLNVPLLNGAVNTAGEFTAAVYNYDETDAFNGTIDNDLTNEYIEQPIFEGGIVKLTIRNKLTDKIIDLALKKVITSINGIPVNTENGFESTDRLTEETNKYGIDTTPLDEGKNDAIYNLNKTPITVLLGSEIEYEIRIYNEGEQDATASEIVDYVPDGLKVVDVYYNGQELTKGTDYEYTEGSPILKIKKLNTLIAAYVPGSGKLSSDKVVVKCVAESASNGRFFTNIAEITKYKTADGEIDEDRDSQTHNFVNPVNGKTNMNVTNEDTTKDKWQNYSGEEEIEDGVFKNYPGQQDDDDFEKIKVVEVDLVLKKIITEVKDSEGNVKELDSKYARFEDGKINTKTTFLDQESKTTAEYYLNKTPVKVNVGDLVTYEIRIYNEGSIDATASEITDYVPKGLKVVGVSYDGENLELGTDYRYNETTNNLYITRLRRENLIEAYNNDGNIKYNDKIRVQCKVTGDVRGTLTNVAEITKYFVKLAENLNCDMTEDRDSQTDGDGEWKPYAGADKETLDGKSGDAGADKETLDGKSGDAWAKYYNIVEYYEGEFNDYPGQQDDDDFEKLIVEDSYKITFKKVIGNEENQPLQNVKLSVNGATTYLDGDNTLEYITDEDGKQLIIDGKKVDVSTGAPGGLDTYTIKEIETPDGYIQLANSIFFGVQASDGKINRYIINLKSERPTDDATTVSINDETSTNEFYTTDTQGRLVKITVKCEKTNGKVEFTIQAENNIESSDYAVYLNKIDGFGNKIEGVKFNVVAQMSDSSYKNDIITSTNASWLGTSKINPTVEPITDVFTINEIETLDKYIVLPDELKLEVKKGINNTTNKTDILEMKLSYGDKSSTTTGSSVKIEDIPVGINGQTITIDATIRDIMSESGKKAKAIDITIPNEPVLQFYGLRIKKVNKVTGEPLEGATFEYGLVGSEEIFETELTDSTGLTNLLRHEIISSASTTTYTITEGQIPQNYLPYQGNIKLNVVTKLEDGVYVLDKENTNVEGKDVTLDITNNIITLIVPDEPTGDYSINIKKVSKKDGTPLAGAIFAIKEASSKEKATETQPTDKSGITNLVSSVKMNSEKTDSYIITETAVPEKYRLYDGEIKLDVAIKLANGQYIIDEANTKVNGKDVSLDVKGSIITITVSDPEKEFDLALRKFISKVNEEELTGEESREPVVDLGTLINGDPAKYGEKTATYTHTKEPKLVCPTDIVEYTLRVYNEGELDGYARQIIDDVPAGVQMVAPMYDEEGKPANLNAQYRWVMYREISNNDINNTEETEKVPYAVNDMIRYADKYYVPTLNADEAVIIATDFLSKKVGEQGLEEGKLNSNLLYAFNGKTLDYADIKVEFTVRPSKDDKTIITNHAQISEHEYKDETSITDRDSTPNVWSEGEDDQDVEHLKVKWFDLALYKWVTTTIVTEDGKTKEYPTEHTQDYKDKLVNVTVEKEKLNKTVVKFKYIVKVENQGTLPGYAKELRDHIPAGLKFIEEDNTEYGWKLEENGTITTNYFKDTLLNPQDSVEIPVVLTWINGTNNLSKKINNAEISKDYNEYGDTPDIDSTPDNFKDIPVEDDEDGDVVMLNIKTGEFINVMFVIIGLYVIVILASGIWGIKRFVLNDR